MIDRAIFESLQAKIDEEAAVRDVCLRLPPQSAKRLKYSIDTNTTLTGAPRHRAESLAKRLSHTTYK